MARVTGEPTASKITSYSPSSSAPAAVAPSRRAWLSLPGSRSVTSTRPAPPDSAVSRQSRPMAPQPSTPTLAPAPAPARRQACTALAAGSTIAATSQPSQSGSGRTAEAGTATCSAKPPERCTPMICRSRQTCRRPPRQSSHWPQDSIGLMTTRAPSALVPANSWPMISGGFLKPGWRAPCSSLPQLPTARTCTRTSPSATSGSGTSRSSRLPGPVNTSAFTWEPPSPENLRRRLGIRRRLKLRHRAAGRCRCRTGRAAWAEPPVAERLRPSRRTAGGSAAEGMALLAGDAWPAREQRAGRRARPGSRADVEHVQVPAAERAAGDVRGRQLDDFLQPAVRTVPLHRPAAPHGDPDAALGIHGEAIRDDIAMAKRGEAAAAADLASGRVIVHDVDPVGQRVDVVHPCLVRAPADPVRDPDAIEEPGQPEVGIQPVQRARPWRLVGGHGARVEPAGPVTRTVVHSVVRHVRLDRDQRGHRAGTG